MFGSNSKSNPAKSTDEKPGLFERLRRKLNRGTSWLTDGLANLIPGGKIDEAVLEELETRLLSADVGVGVAASSVFASGLIRFNGIWLLENGRRE